MFSQDDSSSKEPARTLLNRLSLCEALGVPGIIHFDGRTCSLLVFNLISGCFVCSLEL